MAFELAPKQLWHPRYWLMWLVTGILWLMAQLPLPLLWKLGRFTGWLLYRLAKDRRYFAEQNIQMCFPQLTAEEQRQLVKENFAQMGMGFAETLKAWFGNTQELLNRYDVTGVEHLKAAQNTGKGAIVCVFHSVHIEACGLLSANLAPVHPIYRPHDIPFLEWFAALNRSRHTAGAIPNTNVRKILTTLRRGKLLWLAPDQRSRSDGIPVPFFGHLALTHPSVARMTRTTGAQLVPLFCRLKDDGRFQVDILPPLTDFPGEDDVTAMTRVLALLEADIMKAPAQYLWAHNRFNLPSKKKLARLQQAQQSETE